MEVIDQLRHVFDEEGLIGPHRITSQRRLTFRHPLLEISKNLALRLRHTHPGLPFINEAGRGMHIAHKIIHLRDRRIGGLNNNIDARVHRLEVAVRHNNGNLHQLINARIQACHFAIDPDNRIV